MRYKKTDMTGRTVPVVTSKIVKVCSKIEKKKREVWDLQIYLKTNMKKNLKK